MIEFWDYFKAIAMILAVIAIAFYLTRLLAKTGGGMRRGSAAKLVGSLPLAKDRAVAIVTIGQYAYVLGVSAQRVEKLDRLELSELELDDAQTTPRDFASCLKEQIGSKLGKKVDRL